MKKILFSIVLLPLFSVTLASHAYAATNLTITRVQQIINPVHPTDYEFQVFFTPKISTFILPPDFFTESSFIYNTNPYQEFQQITWNNDATATESSMTFLEPNVAGSYTGTLNVGGNGFSGIFNAAGVSNVFTVNIPGIPQPPLTQVNYREYIFQDQPSLEITFPPIPNDINVYGCHIVWVNSNITGPSCQVEFNSDFTEITGVALNGEYTQTRNNGNSYFTVYLYGNSGNSYVSGYASVESSYNLLDLPPAINPISNALVGEGDTYTGNISFTDRDSSSWTGTIDYGEGSGSQPITITGNNFIISHQYNATGAYPLTLTVTDDQGKTSTATATITVDTPPQVNQLVGGTINEGSTYSENGSFTDPDSSSWTGTIDYGDGSGSQPLSLNSDNTFSLSHQYTSAGTYTVTVAITDNLGGIGTATGQITVNNNMVAPVVESISSSTSPVKVNTSDIFSANFTDQNTQDSHTASWNWGDGNTNSGTVTESNGSGSVSDSHIYTSLGSYTITLSVTDNTNLNGTSQEVVAVIPTNGLHGSNLSHKNYTGVDLNGQNISNANLSVATFNNVNFKNANLSQVNGSNSSFTNDNFTGANLNKVNVSNANLTGSDLTNAILTQANLSNANLTNVNLTGANLQGANLSGTIKTGIIWSNTICPNGQNSNSHNNSCVGQGGGL